MKRFLFFSVLLLVLFSSFAYADLETDTQLYYSFDNDKLSGSDPLDLTPNGNDGTNNGATTNAIGIIEQAFNFDGTSDYITGADTDTIIPNKNNGFTYNVWVNWTDVTGAARQTIFEDYTADVNIRSSSLRILDGGLDWIIYTDTNTFVIDRPSTDLDKDDWVMLSYVYNADDNLLLAYIDGVNIENISTSGNVKDGGDLYIGRFADGSDRYWSGMIDELAIFNKSLTEQEISNLYGSGIGNQYPFSDLMVIDFSNTVSRSGKSYTDNLIYNISFNDCSGTNYLTTRVDNLKIRNESISCNNNTANYLSSYQPLVEGAFNISFDFSGNGTNGSIQNYTFYGDLEAPVTKLGYIEKNGFGLNSSVTIWLFCEDTISPTLEYNITLNSNTNLYNTFNNATNQSVSVATINGTNTYQGTCSDGFRVNKKTITFNAESRYLSLFDETTSNYLNLDNVTTAKIWFYDNSSFFDFKAEGTTNVSVFSTSIQKTRVELGYSDGTVIPRFIDIDLTNSEDIVLVCANKEGTTHYEQLIISSENKDVVMKNSFVNCYVAAATTEFAYQNSFSLRAFTIDSNYYLYTYDDNSQVLLATIDGGIQTFLNLDTLEFSRSQIELKISEEVLGAQKTGNTTLKIYYKNYDNNNDDLSLEITRSDTGASVFSYDEFEDLNEFVLYYDFTTITGINDSTLFKIDVTKTVGSTESTLTRYVSPSGDVGLIPAAVAFIVSIFVLIGGLSIVTTRSAFSWLGIFLGVGIMAVCAFAVNEWYISLMQVFAGMLVIYSILTISWTNQGVVT